MAHRDHRTLCASANPYDRERRHQLCRRQLLGSTADNCESYTDLKRNGIKPANPSGIFGMSLLDDPSNGGNSYLAYAFRTSSSKGDDGTLTDSAAIVGKASLLTCVVGSKSGRRDNVSATTFSCSGIYLTEKLYSANKDNHLAICCERL